MSEVEAADGVVDDPGVASTKAKSPPDVRDEIISSLLSQNEILTKEISKLTAKIDEMSLLLTSNNTNSKTRKPAPASVKKRRLRTLVADVDDVTIDDIDDESMDSVNDTLNSIDTSSNPNANATIASEIDDRSTNCTTNDAPSSNTAFTKFQKATTSAVSSFIWADVVNGIESPNSLGTNKRPVNSKSTSSYSLGTNDLSDAVHIVTPPNNNNNTISTIQQNINSTAAEPNVTNITSTGNVTNNTSTGNVTNNTFMGNVTNNTSTNNVTNSRAKPTPIQLGQMERDQYSVLLNDLSGAFETNAFRWHQLKSFSLPRIFVDDAETKTRIMNWLASKKYQFNTYAERGQRRKAFLIRGLAHGDNDNDSIIQKIRTSVSAAGVDGEFTINRFQTGFMKRSANTNAAPIYQITVAHDVPDSCLASIKAIGLYSVRFEKMKPSKVIQCRRCQRYSHTATMCAHEYRCVQCVDSHQPGCCPRATNKSIPISCCNCKAAGLDFVGHTANDNQNCNFYAKVNTGKTNTTNGTITNRSAPVPRKNDIIESVRANGPTQRNAPTTKKKKKKKNKNNNTNINNNNNNNNSNINKDNNTNNNNINRVTTSNSNSGVSENSVVNSNAGDILGELIAALTHVLDRFRQCRTN